MDSFSRWIIVGGFLVSSPFAAIGAYEAYQTSAQIRAGQQIEGKVVGNRLIVDQRDGVEERAYQPEVTFQSPDGATHRFTDGAASLPPDYAVGDQVTVLYASAHPEQARIASWKRLWLVPTLLIVVGLLPGLVGCAVIWQVGRRP